MAVNLIPIKCPDCGASLNYEEGRKQIFCSYCGTKILIDNENEHVYRHIDDAEITYAETDRLVRLKELELLEQERKDQKRAKRIRVFIFFALMAAAIIFSLYCRHMAEEEFFERDKYNTYAFFGVIVAIVAFVKAIGVFKDTPERKKK